jgi:hypothetical protein
VNRLIRVSNTAKNGGWIIAADYAEALRIAMKVGWARKMDNLVAYDQTDFHLAQPNGSSLRALLEGGKTGIAMIQGTSYSVADLCDALRTTGRAPETPEPKWILNEQNA